MSDYFCRTDLEALRSNDSKILEAPNNSNSWISFSTEAVYTKNYQIIFSDQNVALYIYTLLIFAVILITLLKNFGFSKIAMQASRNLHKKMFSALFEVPIGFFIANPSGRILNRFSKDLGAIDEMLPSSIAFTLQIFLNLLATLVIILISNYFMVLPILIIGGFLFKLQKWYVTIGKNVQDLESIGNLFFFDKKFLLIYNFSQISSVIPYQLHF